MLITTEAGEQFSIEIKSLRTVRDVKESIRHILGISINKQLLTTDGIELEDSRHLSNYGINDSSVIHLMSMHFGMSAMNLMPELTIKTEDGGRFRLRVNPSDTIRDMRRKIADQEGIPSGQQLIVIDDVGVEDHRAISDYNIDEDSTIHLIRMGYATNAVNPPSTGSPGANNINQANRPLSDFYVACRDNDVARLQQLLRTLSVDDMNKLESNGSTGLHVACYQGHREVVELVLKKGVSRSIMNKYKCLPYEEAASDAIRQLFQRIPGNSRYVADSGRVEWLLVALNAPAMAARGIAAVPQHDAQPFASSVKQILDNYIKPHFRDVQNYDMLLRLFQTALRENDPKYLIKAYTAETGFYSKLNADMASETNVGETERKLFLGILAFDPCFERYRISGEAYRGMRLTEDDLKAYTEGQQVMTKSFLSATSDRNEAEFFVNRSDRQDIHGQSVKMGAICTYILRDKRSSLDIHHLSEYPREQEVLVFPYSVFTVTRVQKTAQPGENMRINIILTQRCTDQT